MKLSDAINVLNDHKNGIIVDAKELEEALTIAIRLMTQLN